MDDFKNQKAFTLLEVIITIAILTTMMMAIATLLRGSFDVRSGLANDAKINHRINVAMRAIAEDLTHAYVYSFKNDPDRWGQERTSGTYFEIGKDFNSEFLKFTMNNHKPMMYNAKESDLAFVVYQIQEDKKIQGRSHLYKGIQPRFSNNFKENPPMKVLAKNIKTLKVEYWRGDDWVQDKWNSQQSETRDRMPHQVRITLEAWIEDLEEGDTPKEIHEETIKFSTIVYLHNANKFAELKAKNSSLRL